MYKLQSKGTKIGICRFIEGLSQLHCYTCYNLQYFYIVIDSMAVCFIPYESISASYLF